MSNRRWYDGSKDQARRGRHRILACGSARASSSLLVSDVHVVGPILRFGDVPRCKRSGSNPLYIIYTYVRVSYLPSLHESGVCRSVVLLQLSVILHPNVFAERQSVQGEIRGQHGSLGPRRSRGAGRFLRTRGERAGECACAAERCAQVGGCRHVARAFGRIDVGSWQVSTVRTRGWRTIRRRGGPWPIPSSSAGKGRGRATPGSSATVT